MIAEKIRTGIAVACIPLVGALIVLAVINISTAHHRPPIGPGPVRERQPIRIRAHTPAGRIGLDQQV